ncbi:MAG: ATPase, T2SS/T4P/T4SS family [Pirellulales bacterium]
MSRETIYEASADYFLAPIGDFMRDDTVTEIMVNGFDDIYVERRGKIEHTNTSFESEDALISAIHNIAQWVGREIDPERPILDARLPNGSRVNAIIPPSARTGTYLTIRKFLRDVLSMDDWIRYGSISPEAAEFLDVCVRLRKNILVSGGTGTGKTSFLNALSVSIPEEERIVVIEETSELRLAQEHCLYLEAQQGDRQGRGHVSVRQLFVNSLRMRPDRIIVGEVRSGEALDLIQSMISGHAGSISTVHANTARDALVRMETLSLMSDIEIPIYVARAQVASAIDLVVQISRFAEDGSRRVTKISETYGLDDQNRYQAQDLYVCKLTGKRQDGTLAAELVPTGAKPTFSSEPFDQAMGDRVKLTANLWKQ